MQREVKIHWKAPGNADVLVDGRNVNTLTRGFALFAEDPDTMPGLVLNLNAAKGVYYDGPATVTISEECAEALEVLGWRRPEDVHEEPTDNGPGAEDGKGF